MHRKYLDHSLIHLNASQVEELKKAPLLMQFGLLVIPCWALYSLCGIL